MTAQDICTGQQLIETLAEFGVDVSTADLFHHSKSIVSLVLGRPRKDVSGNHGRDVYPVMIGPGSPGPSGELADATFDVSAVNVAAGLEVLEQFSWRTELELGVRSLEELSTKADFLASVDLGRIVAVSKSFAAAVIARHLGDVDYTRDLIWGYERSDVRTELVAHIKNSVAPAMGWVLTAADMAALADLTYAHVLVALRDADETFRYLLPGVRLATMSAHRSGCEIVNCQGECNPVYRTHPGDKVEQVTIIHRAVGPMLACDLATALADCDPGQRIVVDVRSLPRKSRPEFVELVLAKVEPGADTTVSLVVGDKHEPI